MDVSLTLTPNNEIRIQYLSLPAARKKGSDDSFDLERKRYAALHVASQEEVFFGRTFAALLSPGSPLANNTVLSLEEGLSRQKSSGRALDVITDFQTTTKRKQNERRTRARPGYGAAAKPTRFGSYARRKLLSAGNLLSRRSKHPSESVLVTLTLPGDNPAAFARLGEWSGGLINNVLSVLRKEIRRISRTFRGFECHWFYVWELQKRGALHLHLCLWSKIPMQSLHLGNTVAKSWIARLKVLGSQYDCFLTRRNGKSCFLPAAWQNDVSPTKKDVSRYLSKYVSKQAAPVKNEVSFGERYGCYPTRWWGMDRALSREVEAASASVKVVGLSDSRAVGLGGLLAKELRQIAVVTRSYSRHDTISHGDSVIGSVTTMGFYVRTKDYDLCLEWLPRFMIYLVKDVHPSRLRYKGTRAIEDHLYVPDILPVPFSISRKESVTSFRKGSTMGGVEFSGDSLSLCLGAEKDQELVSQRSRKQGWSGLEAKLLALTQPLLLTKQVTSEASLTSSMSMNAYQQLTLDLGTIPSLTNSLWRQKYT